MHVYEKPHSLPHNELRQTRSIAAAKKRYSLITASIIKPAAAGVRLTL